MKVCIFCSEEIKEDAIICKHCGKEQWKIKKLVKEAKTEVLSMWPYWKIRDEENDYVNFLYHKSEEKASCGKACLLGCFFWPFAIIYALLWGKKEKNGQIMIKEIDWKIYVSWDASYILNVYNKLSSSTFGEHVIETEEIKKAKKVLILTRMLIAIFILFFIVLITDSK